VIAGEVRQAVAQLDRSVLVETETLEDHIDDSLAGDRLLALLSGSLGGISLLLAAMGLFGVMAYAVVRRTAEIGVRLALGAPPAAVLSMVLREGFQVALVGLTVGGVAASASSQVIGSLLFGVSPHDALVFGGATGVMAVVSLVAAFVPALRAARVDPVVALRGR
jgi:ABC-type antimicrobial peptide transport system permease subunit